MEIAVASLWSSKFMENCSCKKYDTGEQFKLSKESREAPRSGLCWNDQCDLLPLKSDRGKKLTYAR